MRMKKTNKQPRQSRQAIHTNIPATTYDILMQLGDGLLNDGIVKAVDLAMRKQYTVQAELHKIASHILSNYTVPENS